MTLQVITDKIKKRTKKEFYIRAKEYKSTYISVIRNQKLIKLSLHKLFLNAPENIIENIVNFTLKKEKEDYIEIKKYAHEYFSKIDYSKRIDDTKLSFIGKTYNLKQILENLNEKYFNNLLDLKITYFSAKYRKFSYFTFGSYDNTLKLIKINKILDNINVPFYFIYYVVYHEMLHHIVKVKINKNSSRDVHSKEFKKLEKQFPYYKEAINWEKNIFNKRRKNGWSF
ncbi:MAG: hypothetical protein K1060chlam5_00801 [Candidatus Anoxychlamydiales bacterium]|nr:hypothetical protein [Candidatus Anoxychlamydiales bacterium]